MYFKKIVAVLLAGALALSVVGCNKQVETAAKPRIGFILGDMVNEFYLQMIEAGNQAAKEYGAEVIWQSCESSVEKEVSLIENFVLQNVDCIVLDPMDAKGVVAAVNMATQAGIPVVTCANLVEGNSNYMTLYPDRKNIERATEAVCYAIGQEGKVGLLSGDAGSWVIGQREQGFKDAIEKFPNITGDIQLTKYDTAIASNITENWINTGGIDGIVSVSDTFVLASITAAENMGAADKIYWAGNDGNSKNLSLMNTKNQIIDHLTGGYRVGYWNVAVAARIIAGERLPREMYLNCYTVMTDETAEKLKGLGFECDYITPDEAAKKAVDSSNEYGPQVSTGEFIG